MLKSLTIAILVGASGLLAGLFVPGFVAYSVLFFRKHGPTLKTGLRLSGRLLLAFFIFGLSLAAFQELTQLLGGSEGLASDVEGNSLLIGANIGFWGAVAGLVVGARRARRHHATRSQ